MYLFNMATLFIIVTLVGVEFSVSAFVNPAAWRLDPRIAVEDAWPFRFGPWKSDAGLVPGLHRSARYSDLASLVRLGTQTPACSGCDLGCCFHRIDLFAGSTK